MCYYRDPNGAESNNKHLDEETPYWDSYDSINQLYLELGNDTFLLQPLHTSILLYKFTLQVFFWRSIMQYWNLRLSYNVFLIISANRSCLVLLGYVSVYAS